MDKKTIKHSKFLSLVLRHKPEQIGLTLDDAGWVDVDKLLTAMAQHGRAMTRAELEQVVATNDKRRFAFSEDSQRIRANQGHSVSVELGYQPAAPPAVLYHGTVGRFLNSIYTQGLIPGQRHHVHLSSDVETARRVGQRRGQPVVLVVNAQQMHADGHQFYLSENGVWLTAHVPPSYLETSVQE